MSTTIRPLHDLVLIKVDPPQKFSDIIAIPDSLKEDYPIGIGTVLRKGPGRWKLKSAQSDKGQKVFVETQVTLGARVAFFSGVLHKKKGASLMWDLPNDFALIHESDIFFEFEGDLKVDIG